MRPQEGDHVSGLESWTDRADGEVRHLHEVLAPIAARSHHVVLERCRSALVLAGAAEIEVQRSELRGGVVLHQSPHVEEQLLVGLGEGRAVRVSQAQQVGMGRPDDEDPGSEGGKLLEQTVGNPEPVRVAV